MTARCLVSSASCRTASSWLRVVAGRWWSATSITMRALTAGGLGRRIASCSMTSRRAGWMRSWCGTWTGCIESRRSLRSSWRPANAPGCGRSRRCPVTWTSPAMTDCSLRGSSVRWPGKRATTRAGGSSASTRSWPERGSQLVVGRVRSVTSLVAGLCARTRRR